MLFGGSLHLGEASTPSGYTLLLPHNAQDIQEEGPLSQQYTLNPTAVCLRLSCLLGFVAMRVMILLQLGSHV